MHFDLSVVYVVPLVIVVIIHKNIMSAALDDLLMELMYVCTVYLRILWPPIDTPHACSQFPYQSMGIRTLSLNPAIAPKSINGNMYTVHNIVYIHMALDHVLGSGCPQVAWEMIVM